MQSTLIREDRLWLQEPKQIGKFLIPTQLRENSVLSGTKSVETYIHRRHHQRLGAGGNPVSIGAERARGFFLMSVSSTPGNTFPGIMD